MLNNTLINHLSDQISQTITSHNPLQGGDINDVYLIKTTDDQFILKVNSAKQFPGMFEAEEKGLTELSIHSSMAVAKSTKVGALDDHAYLMLNYINKGQSTLEFWETFGHQLNRLHQATQSKFGYTSKNYIGSLPQYNSNCDTWAEFYTTQRLEPQLKLLVQKGHLKGSISKFEKLYNKLENWFPVEPPALLHGDLWSGNFIIGENNKPWLIDPAVYYGHREMDIGMTLLFGGFNERFYEAYNFNYPLESDWSSRVPLTQLYPLMVHANLFEGGGYLKSVESILNNFV